MTNHEPHFFSQPSLARPRPADTRISPIFAHSLQTAVPEHTPRTRHWFSAYVNRRYAQGASETRVDPFVLIWSVLGWYLRLRRGSGPRARVHRLTDPSETPRARLSCVRHRRGSSGHSVAANSTAPSRSSPA